MGPFAYVGSRGREEEAAERQRLRPRGPHLDRPDRRVDVVLGQERRGLLVEHRPGRVADGHHRRVPVSEQEDVGTVEGDAGGWADLGLLDGPPGWSVVVTYAVKSRGAPNWALPLGSSKVASIDFRSMVNGGGLLRSSHGPGQERVVAPTAVDEELHPR